MVYLNPHFGAYVIPLLQPALYKGDILSARDPQEHLNLILHLLEGTENVEEALHRLRPLEEEVNRGWQRALSHQFAITRDPNAGAVPYDCSYFIEQLWKISRSRLKKESVNDAVSYAQQVMHAYHSMYQDKLSTPGNGICLHPYISRGKDIITGVAFPDPSEERTPHDVDLAQATILFFEALRQQLLTRKGILCPAPLLAAGNPQMAVRNLQTCLCNKYVTKYIPEFDMRKLLIGLHRVVGELFGVEGSPDWSELPCKS